MDIEEKKALLKRALEEEALRSDELTIEQKRNLLRKSMLGDIQPAQEVSMIGSAARGAMRSFSPDIADELAGAIDVGRDVLGGQFDTEKLGETYRAGRQKHRELQREDLEQNPASTTAGMVGGAVAQQAVMPAKVAATIGKMGKLGQYGVTAAQGALYGYGASESDNPFIQMEDIGKGAVLAPAVRFGLEKAPGRERLAELLKARAAEKAVKASGAMKKEFDALNRSKLLQPQGRWLLKNKVVTPLASLEDIAERSGTLRLSAGERIGQIIDKADDLIQRAIEPAKKFASRDAGTWAAGTQSGIQNKKMADEYINQVKSEFGFSFQRVADRISGIMERDSKLGAAQAYHFPNLEKLRGIFASFGSGTLREGLRNKTEQRRLLKRVESLSDEYKQEIYDILSDELEQSVSKIPYLQRGVERIEAQLATDPAQKLIANKASNIDDEAKALVDQWRGANRDYAASAVAEKTARDRLGQVMSNRDFGLTTGMATAAGFVTGGPTTAMALGGVNNFFRKYGSSLQAVGYDRLADALMRDLPEEAVRYGPSLRDALRKGISQFVLTNYLIAKQDPKYQSFIERLLGGEDEASPTIQR